METLKFDDLPQVVQCIDLRLERIEEILKNQPSLEPDRMYTVPEVAEYLHLSVPSIYRLISQRIIPHKKVNGRVWFIKSEIDKWINGHSRKTVEELKEEVYNQ
jgi:excisionase family DNA binding protein